MSMRFPALMLWLGTLAGPAAAMDFAIAETSDGLRVVSAKGSIVSGDARRLDLALRSADRDPYGNKRLVLDSIGGNVGEALAMVAIMDREKVTTVIEGKAECASACAQILFLSGVHRFVLDGGRLGLHSCYEGRPGGKRGEVAKSTPCNDLIAQNAVAHGTSYASIMAFMQYTDPKKVRWFDAEEADCWGLTRWPPEANRGTKTGDMPPCLLRGYNGKSSTDVSRPSK
jgi:hypothetical protein